MVRLFRLYYPPPVSEYMGRILRTDHIHATTPFGRPGEPGYEWLLREYSGGPRFVLLSQALRYTEEDRATGAGHALLLWVDRQQRSYNVFDPAEHDEVWVRDRKQPFASFHALYQEFWPLIGDDDPRHAAAPYRLDPKRQQQTQGYDIQLRLENYEEHDFGDQQAEEGLCVCCCWLVAAVALRFQFFDCWAIGSAVGRYLAEEADVTRNRFRRTKEHTESLMKAMWNGEVGLAHAMADLFRGPSHPIGAFTARMESVRLQLLDLYHTRLSRKTQLGDLETILGLRCPLETATCGVWDDTTQRFCCTVPCEGSTFCALHRWRLLHSSERWTPVPGCGTDRLVGLIDVAKRLGSSPDTTTKHTTMLMLRPPNHPPNDSDRPERIACPHCSNAPSPRWWPWGGGSWTRISPESSASDPTKHCRA